MKALPYCLGTNYNKIRYKDAEGVKPGTFYYWSGILGTAASTNSHFLEEKTVCSHKVLQEKI
jgi:hypothetical protein